MKTLILFILISSLLSTQSVCQENQDISVVYMPEYKGNDTFRSYYLYEEVADRFLNTLLELNGKQKGKKSMHRFRSQTIEGLEKPVTLRVHEGIYMEGDSSAGFNTFLNPKDRVYRLSNIKPNEKPGIIVYIIHNSRFSGRDVINSDQKNKLALKYLHKLLN